MNGTPNRPPGAAKVGTWDQAPGQKPSWVREDGTHDAAAHTAAGQALAAEALKYKRPMPPEKGGKSRPTHNYQTHPDGTARVRWQKSGSLLSFPEWCLEQGLAER